jgi:serine/threonine protein kinase
MIQLSFFSFAMSSPFLNIQGDPIPQEQVLGSGGSAVVLLQNNVAVKTPLRYIWSSDSDVRVNTESLRREQDVYRRLQGLEDERSDGVVRCIGFSTEATQLAYMANGDLRTYLAKRHPSYQLQLTWFREMARTLSYIHDRRVLVADIASRNFLLDSDLSLKICDFSEASLFPLDSNMDAVDDNGFTTQIDIGLLGAVIYEIVTGNKCEVDLFRDNSPTDGRAHWPERKSLPSTQDIWLGWIVEGCWDGKFRSAHSLLQALNSVALPFSALVAQPRVNHLEIYVKNIMSGRPIATITGGLALAAFALIVGKKAFLMSRDFLRSL